MRLEPAEVTAIERIELKVDELRHAIEHEIPPCRRRSIALTQLETAYLFAKEAVVFPDA